VVNAAGLHAAAVAAAIEGLPATGWRPHRLCQGRYLGLAGRAPFSRLVYPVHNRAGLGVHLTLDLAGQARFGPDVHWLPAGTAPEAVDLSVPESVAPGFEAAIRRYWPGLPANALAPAYSGLRPKVVGPQDPAGDFVLRGQAVHGAPGWVDLLGLESPGLTACLAVADAVEDLLSG
jgi:L-2-hydroxyglutarate oxidase LhgO